MTDTFESVDSALEDVTRGKSKMSKRVAKTNLLDMNTSFKPGAPISVPMTEEDVNKANVRNAVENEARVADERSQEFLVSFGTSFSTAFGGFGRDVYEASVREQASAEVDPSWDVGTVREEFRGAHGMEYWNALEQTKNRAQYDALVKHLEEKQTHDAALGQSTSGALLGSLFDPLALLGGAGILKGGMTAAKTFNLSRKTALAGGAAAEGALYSGIESYKQKSETGVVYDPMAVGQTLAIAGALHYGAGRMFTKDSQYIGVPGEASTPIKPPAVRDRVEPYISTPDVEQVAQAEANSMIYEARGALADMHQRIAEDIATAGNKLGAGEPKQLHAESKQLSHSLKYFDETYEGNFKARAKELQGTGMSRKEAESAASKELAARRADIEGRLGNIQARLDSHAAAVQAEERLNLHAKGRSPYEPIPEAPSALQEAAAARAEAQAAEQAAPDSAAVDAGAAANTGRDEAMSGNIIKSESESVQDWQDLYTRDDSALRSLVGDKAFEWLHSATGKTSAFFSNTLRGLSSASPVVRAAANVLGEDATGMFRAGARNTSIDKARFNNIMRGQYSSVHDEYRAWLKRQGKGGMLGAHTGVLEQEFNSALRLEMEARWNTRNLSADEIKALDAERWKTTDPEVKRAADALDSGNQKALDLMKEYKVLGAEGLSDISRGYVPRRMNGKYLQDLHRTNPAVYTQIEKALGRRFFDSFTAMQKALIAAGEKDIKPISEAKAATIAQGMMRRAIDRASGMDGSTIGLLDRAARDEIRTILESKGMDFTDIEHTFKLMDKRLGSKSGSNRLKGRMEVDIASPVELEDGSKFALTDLFDNDLNKLMYSYAEEMSGRIALARQGITSDNDFEQLLNAVKNENKSENVAEDIQLLRDMYSTMLGRPLQGQGQSKIAQILTQLNPLQSLGQVGWAQASESSLAVARLGIGAMMKSIPMAARLIVGARKGMLSADDALILKDIEALNGPVGEFWRTHRPSTDVMERLNKDGQIAHTADRLLKAGQHLNGYISFMHQIMEAQLKTTAVLATRQFAKEIQAGVLTKRIADAGWTKDSMAAVKRQLDQHAVFERGELKDLNVSAWTDRNAVDDFARNIERLSGQLIQRDYAGESASWMHKDMGRLLLSLRGYSVRAFNKQLVRNVQIGDAIAAQSVALGLAFSSLSYTAKMYTMSAMREDREEFLAERLSPMALAQGALGYMALGSFGPELLRPLASWYAEGNGQDGAIRSGGNAVVAAIPGLAPIERATTVLGDIGSSLLGGEDWSARRTRHVANFFLGNSAPVALALNASVDDSE